jgi:hypothetical protein
MNNVLFIFNLGARNIYRESKRIHKGKGNDSQTDVEKNMKNVSIRKRSLLAYTILKVPCVFIN